MTASPQNLFAVGVIGVWLLLFVRGLRSMRRGATVLPKPDYDAAWRGSVTAFIPARDEVDTIAASVSGMLAQGDLLAATTVIDDGSSDGTSEVLRDLAEQHPGLCVMQGHGPGEGECGKPAALRAAVDATAPQTEWLLFVDADVVLVSGAVSALLERAEALGADVVSGFPQVELGTTIERIVMPAVGALIVANHPPEAVEDPSKAAAFANGQLILVRRDCYEAAGGHESVVSEILEDVRLAERLKQSGAQLALVGLERLASTRMYTGWTDLREGWSKNLFLLVGGRRGRALIWAGLSVLLGWSGLLALAVAGWPLGAVAYGWVLATQGGLRKLGGASWPWAILAPIGSIAVAYLLLRSMRLHEAGQAIEWKGRAYRS